MLFLIKIDKFKKWYIIFLINERILKNEKNELKTIIYDYVGNLEKTKEELKDQGIENPTDDDINSYMNNKVNVVHKNLGKTAGLFDYSFELGSVT